MNNASSDKKESILKSLAVLGFIGIIIIIAWLSIQFVKVLPGAFSSLASLAESVNERQLAVSENPDVVSLTVTSSVSLVNHDEPVELSWDKAKVPGSYTFSYACSEGIAVDLLNVDGMRSIACDTNYNIGDNTSLSIKADSEKNRYANLDYTISFLRTNDTKPSAAGNASITIVNSTISDIIGGEEIVPEETEVEETVVVEEVVVIEEPVVEEVVPEVVVEPVVTKPVTKPVTETPAPTYQQEFVYAIPTSDPNGRTDLSTRFLNVGTIVGQTFFIGAVKQNEKGAIQFEVKNYGTKTSASWTFTVALPNGGTYQSDEQNPLKPNERAVLTIGFPTDNDASHKFVVSVKESTETNLNNNQFAETVTFVK